VPLLLSGVLVACCVAFAFRERRSRVAADRKLQELTAKLEAQWKYTEEACAKLSEERDRALVERNGAIDGVRYRPMTLREISSLARTHCSSCHGAGHYSVRAGEVVCDCVRRRMSEDLKYGWSGAIPVQLATPEEVAAFSVKARA
jgi:hypothetical protein